MDAQRIRRLRPKLTRFLSRFDDCFQRRDTRAHLPTYVQGQLSELPDKSVEPIAVKFDVAADAAVAKPSITAAVDHLAAGRLGDEGTPRTPRC